MYLLLLQQLTLPLLMSSYNLYLLYLYYLTAVRRTDFISKTNTMVEKEPYAPSYMGESTDITND